MKIFELVPIDGRKSFYGKCFVKDYMNGHVVLQSYQTDVAEIRDGVFRLLNEWNQLTKSRTTKRHINAFKKYYGIDN